MRIQRPAERSYELAARHHPGGRVSRYRPPFDPTITQKVKNALYDAGREDLVEALMESGLKELEEQVDLLKKRLVALEQEKVKWQTESGVYRILDKKVTKAAFNWMRWAIRGTLSVIGLGILKLAWKGLHS